jgi:hypothetical protein
VVSRFKLDGTCVVGEGYPPLWVNPRAAKDTPVYVVTGVKEWLWMIEHQNKKNENNPEKIPHFLWIGKDMDIKFLAGALKEKTVKVIRSKNNQEQIESAVVLNNELKNKWNINCEIYPPLQKQEKFSYTGQT